MPAVRAPEYVPDGITAALDCIGGEANDISLAQLGTPERAVTLADWQAEHRLGVRRVGTDRSATRLASLLTHYEKGTLTIPIWKHFPLDKAPPAHHEIETGHARGKIALITT